VVLSILAVSALAIPTSAQTNSVWFEIAQDRWVIESEADSIGPDIELWAFSDCELGDLLSGVSIGFEVRFDTIGFGHDRWAVNCTTSAYLYGTYTACRSSVDSHIVVDDFIINQSLPAQSKRPPSA